MNKYVKEVKDFYKFIAKNIFGYKSIGDKGIKKKKVKKKEKIKRTQKAPRKRVESTSSHQ